MPVNSPCAPAAGCRVMASMPVISMQAALEQVDDFEDALGERVGAVGMGFGEALDAGDELVDARVVLHGAGAERIHAEIDGVVPGGEAREVADDLDLAQLGELRVCLSRCGAQQCGGVDGGHVERGQLVGALAGRGLLEDQRLRSASGGGGLCRGWCGGWFRWLPFMPPRGRLRRCWRRCRSGLW